MTTALVILAAAEKSKTAFYVVGGAFAVWALVVSALGITQPSFPSGKGGRAGVIAISAVLMAGAMATAVATAG